MEKLTMSEDDRAQATIHGVWYPLCPHCDTETPAEPDAEMVYCISCDQLIEIDNLYV